MSAFEKFLAGWRFRSRTPTYEPGTELVAYVTDADGEDSVIRIGDSRLELDERVPTDTQVRVRVTAFDDESHTGDAELLEVLGTAEF